MGEKTLLTIDELQKFVEESIPLARKAGYKIEMATAERVRVTGTKEKNRNHHGSVFGGSISAVMILTGWLLVREIIEQEEPGSHIVVASQSTRFLKPCRTDFSVEARRPGKEEMEQILNKFHESGRVRINVSVFLREKDGNEPCASFSGEFYVKKP